LKKNIMMITLLAALSASAVFGSSEKALILTHNAHPVDCLAPVTIKKIDGKQILVSPLGFELEPGVHSINGHAKLNTSFCPVNAAGNRGGYAPDLEMNFEAGKTYYVGYDHKSKNRREWKLIVWKVE